MGYKTTISGILLLLSSASISAEGYRADSIAHLIHQPPIAAETLSSYRGGFMISDNYIINIGLSITATIDGMQIFNTQIANLKIENGDLRGASVTSSEASAIANVIQVGSGNDFQIGSANAAEAIIGENSITHIIQNTLNNKVIHLNTALNIDAQVSSVIKQMQVNKKLEDSILSSFY